MTNEREASIYKGKTVKIKDGVPAVGGQSYQVEDWWINIDGKSWKVANSALVCMIYAARVAQHNLPLDDDVLYGRINDDTKGLIHLSEIVTD